MYLSVYSGDGEWAHFVLFFGGKGPSSVLFALCPAGYHWSFVNCPMSPRPLGLEALGTRKRTSMASLIKGTPPRGQRRTQRRNATRPPYERTPDYSHLLGKTILFPDPHPFVKLAFIRGPRDRIRGGIGPFTDPYMALFVHMPMLPRP